MSATPGKIDNRLVTWEGLKDYHNNFLRAIPKLGYNNTIKGQYSFGFGQDNVVTGDNSFIVGKHLNAKGNQVVFGQYNKEDENALFMIGAGDKDQKKNLFLIDKTGSFKTFNTNILIQNDVETEQNQILDVEAVNPSNEILYKTTNAIILGGKNNKIASSYGFICGLNNLIDLTSTTTPISDTTSLKETPAFVLGKGLKISFQDTQARTGPILITGQYNDRNANYFNAAFVIGGGNSDQDRKNLLVVGYPDNSGNSELYMASGLNFYKNELVHFYSTEVDIDDITHMHQSISAYSLILKGSVANGGIGSIRPRYNEGLETDQMYIQNLTTEIIKPDRVLNCIEVYNRDVENPNYLILEFDMPPILANTPEHLFWFSCPVGSGFIATDNSPILMPHPTKSSEGSAYMLIEASAQILGSYIQILIQPFDLQLDQAATTTYKETKWMSVLDFFQSSLRLLY